MKKISAMSLVLLALTAPILAQRGQAKWEFAVFCGYGLGQEQASSRYAREWSLMYLNPIREETRVAWSKSGAAAYFVEASYFPGAHWGLQWGAAAYSPAAAGTAEWALDWHWTDTNEAFSRNGALSAPGSRNECRILFFNLLWRYRLGKIDLTASLGPVYGFHSFRADSSAVAADSIFLAEDWGWDQRFDYFVIPMKTRRTWTGWGVDAGLSIGLRISDHLSLCLEGRYFKLPSRKMEWIWIPGSYNGEAAVINACSFTEEAASRAGLLTSEYSVNSSFFSLSGGLRIGVNP
jgi:hypothetical protein